MSSLFSKLKFTPSLSDAEQQRVRVALVHGTHRAVDRVMRRWKQVQASNVENAEMSSGDDSGRLGLGDQIPEAVELVAHLEDILFHGLKKSKDGSLHCWHFLETLSRENNLAFGPTILAVSMCTAVRTERGLCRAWLRKALNQNCLHYCFETLFSKSKQRVRGNYYDSCAFARDDEATAALRQLLKPLESLPADFLVDDPGLDTVRAIDAEDAMISAKKVKSEAEDKEIEIRLTQCGVPALNGFYRPALISVSHGLHEQRKVAARGSGKEILRFKHITSNAAVLCTTNGPIVSVIVDDPEPIRTPARPPGPSESLDTANKRVSEPAATNPSSTTLDVAADESLVMQEPPVASTQPLRWTIVDDQQNVMYFASSSMIVACEDFDAAPLWSVVPPKQGWEVFVDESSGTVTGAAPPPNINVAMRGVAPDLRRRADKTPATTRDKILSILSPTANPTTPSGTSRLRSFGSFSSPLASEGSHVTLDSSSVEPPRRDTRSSFGEVFLGDPGTGMDVERPASLCASPPVVPQRRASSAASNTEQPVQTLAATPQPPPVIVSGPVADGSAPQSSGQLPAVVPAPRPAFVPVTADTFVSPLPTHKTPSSTMVNGQAPKLGALPAFPMAVHESPSLAAPSVPTPTSAASGASSPSWSSLMLLSRRKQLVRQSTAGITPTTLNSDLSVPSAPAGVPKPTKVKRRLSRSAIFVSDGSDKLLDSKDGMLDLSIAQSEQSCPMTIGYVVTAPTPQSVPSDFTSPSSSQRRSPQSTTEVQVAPHGKRATAVDRRDVVPADAQLPANPSCCQQISEHRPVSPSTEPPEGSVKVAEAGAIHAPQVTDAAVASVGDSPDNTTVSDVVDRLISRVIVAASMGVREEPCTSDDIREVVTAVTQSAISDAVAAFDASTPRIQQDIDVVAVSIVESILNDVIQRIDAGEVTQVVEAEHDEAVVADLASSVLACVTASTETTVGTATKEDGIDVVATVAEVSQTPCEPPFSTQSPPAVPEVAPSPALIVEVSEIVDVSSTVRPVESPSEFGDNVAFLPESAIVSSGPLPSAVPVPIPPPSCGAVAVVDAPLVVEVAVLAPVCEDDSDADCLLDSDADIDDTLSVVSV